MSIFPQEYPPETTQPTYLPSTQVTFVATFENLKVIPGTFDLAFRSVAILDTTAVPITYPGAGTRLYMDPPGGAHTFLRTVASNLLNGGPSEQGTWYSNRARTKIMANNFDESIGTESGTSMCMSCPTDRISKGQIEGVYNGGDPYPVAGDAVDGRYNPHVVNLMAMPNTASAPYAGNVVGGVKFRIDLAAVSDVYYGEDYANVVGYELTDMVLRCKCIADDGTRTPVTFRVEVTNETSIDSKKVNYNCSVSNPAESVYMTFINYGNVSTNGLPHLVCQPLPGVPPYGYTGGTTALYDYGIEKLIFSINSNQLALVGYTFESREDILYNGILAVGGNPMTYSTLLRKMRHPILAYRDGYVAGIKFNGLIDFTKVDFACQINSQCDPVGNNYRALFVFNTVMQLASA